MVQRLAIPYLESLNLLYALTETTKDTVDGMPFALFLRLREIVLVGDRDEKNMSALHAPLDVSLLDVLDVRRGKEASILQWMADAAMGTLQIWSRVVAMGASVRCFV